MKRQLYISDLDGTLLNSRKKIPGEAVRTLNKLMTQDKISFSIATARTPATVEVLLEELAINEPVILMNGTAVYDLKDHCYIDVEYISKGSFDEILRICEEDIGQGFIYTIQDNELVVYYEDLTKEERRAFFEERQHLKYKKFVKGRPLKQDGIAYFVFIDDQNNIQAIEEKLKAVKGIAMVRYRDIYSDEGWILEVYSRRATKANGIKKLKERGGFEEVICFGDNLNDLSMFEVSDRAYAVSNAVEEVKKCAAGVIGSCEESAVPLFIQNELAKNKLEEIR